MKFILMFLLIVSFNGYSQSKDSLTIKRDIASRVIHDSISKYIVLNYGRKYYDTSDIYFENTVFIEDSTGRIYMDFDNYGKDTINIKFFIRYFSISSVLKKHLEVLKNYNNIKYKYPRQVFVDIIYLNDFAEKKRNRDCYPEFNE